MDFTPSSFKIGILGGGQLGKMLAQEASKLDFNLHFLDRDKDYPAGKICPRFTEGDFSNYEDVLAFGRNMDVVSIEIEHVHTQALHQLETEGIKVYPQPAILELIQDKGLQKQFYQSHGLPTAPFELYDSPEHLLDALKKGTLQYPFVQKSRMGGYDGRGVLVVREPDHASPLLSGPSVVEKLADIEKEISVIAVRSASGELKVYPAVSMDFHPTANLVEYLVCPAEIPSNIEKQAEELAATLAEQLQITGLLAVEMFYNKDGSLWINEMAPRPHNSGHHTLDNGATSQFENHLRALSGLPLGDTSCLQPAIMLNLLGEAPYSGPAIYRGLDQILGLSGVHVHLYGKDETRPFRKMGHVTITGADLAGCKEKATFVQQQLKVIA
ncbi:MAG TPA: 5-(carboxyamino)imidazole ribonucleotide synthase [Saprospiraceae bacterium]|nr:5-(carboxyamino)imidazole ribonucleotide synthase [Saprospiraceae bacterium]